MKVLLISLGCDKNRVDSEYMLGKLLAAGYKVTDDEEQADVIVINTCCFIYDAQEESVETMLSMAEYKKTGSLKALIVSGCMAERYRDEIRREIPEIDACIGTNSTEAILEAIESALAGKGYEEFRPLTGIEFHAAGRCVSTGGYYAYLKIAEGCDKQCTYCIIPKLRGSYRSVPMDVLLAEAQKLADSGTKELILVAQETTLYGKDLYGKKMLPKLLEGLNQIDGIEWIHLLYCYPEEVDEELIDAILANKKVCHYLDMPIQHINTDILRRMGRRTSREDIEAVIRLLKQRIPDIAIRTTLISGFPGETPGQHEELMQFVNDTEFDRLGVFPYSQEEDTPACAFLNQVPEEVRRSWADEVMELQAEVSLDKNRDMIGRTMDVLIEGSLAQEDGVYLGRSYRDAPDIDGYVFVKNDYELLSGTIVSVRITEAYEYDLLGELVLTDGER